MGIIANSKHYIARKAVSVAQKAADGIAATSALSPKQLENVANKRNEYLTSKPNMDGDATQAIIAKYLGAIGIEVYQAYLPQLRSIYTPADTAVEIFDALNRIRYFDITKWVFSSEEQSLDKLVNVYQVLSEEDCNIALIYHRTMDKCVVTVGVANTMEEQADPAKAITYEARLKSAIHGNFPGVEIRANRGNSDFFGMGIPDNLKSVVTKNEVQSVAVVSNVASEKSEKFISQSMEKLLDGVIPQSEEENYTIVLLAKPVKDQLESKNRLFELYSALSPYSTWETNYTYTQSDAINASSSFGINLGVSAGAQVSSASSTGQNKAQLWNENSDDGILKKLGKGIVGRVGEASGMYASIQNTNSTSTTRGYNANANFGVSFSRSSSVTAQVGINEGISQNYTNYGVKHTLDIIEKQMKRIEESSALGMWEFAAYVISPSPIIANNVAHMYLALTQGDDSFMAKAAINLWDGEEDKDEAQAILLNIQKLQHPAFGLNESITDEWLLYPTLVTPTAVLSGKELAKSLNFPRKSVSGLPVLQSASFGREVQKFTESKKEARTILAGNIYHMRHDEPMKVNLDIESFASHVFIIGSTGAGKSNTIYQLIDQLHDNGVKFLIIEPAKGEYKKVFGGGCKVYGTNTAISELLRVNPFSFPRGIHVLEHIDRLIEILNACWPMYAAMPAVLKDAVEKCYENVGWNLCYSKCEPLCFPTFADLMQILPEVMNESLYSEETKSDYSGALITRVHSLTNGIYGQIFCSSNELTSKDLFENNVIADLSRIGSSETKSLLMGILVMKLQEYRLSKSEMNSKLLHVTVLEEAHNLLRRTSFSQSQESSNLQGKSVEMITNAIAEMRTYGEGFIIADQAPGLLDEATIRNTNTKIVLRLPEKADRDLVGAAMALTEEQIVELAKLPQGVAAIYQNDWIEAVLCHFSKYGKMNPLQYNAAEQQMPFEKYFLTLFGVKEKAKFAAEDVDTIRDWIKHLKENTETIDILNGSLAGDNLSPHQKEIIAYNIFGGKNIAMILAKEKNADKGIEKANKKIKSILGFERNDLAETIRRHIMDVIFRTNEDGELRRRYYSVEVQRRQML